LFLLLLILEDTVSRFLESMQHLFHCPPILAHLVQIFALSVVHVSIQLGCLFVNANLIIYRMIVRKRNSSLQLGETVSGSVSEGEWNYFSFDPDSVITPLTKPTYHSEESYYVDIVLNHTSPDHSGSLVLYIRWDELPTQQSFDVINKTQSQNGFLRINNFKVIPHNGTWFIGVHTKSGQVIYSLFVQRSSGNNPNVNLLAFILSLLGVSICAIVIGIGGVVSYTYYKWKKQQWHSYEPLSLDDDDGPPTSLESDVPSEL